MAFEVTVTIQTPVGTFNAGTVSLLDENITSEGGILDYFESDINDYVAENCAEDSDEYDPDFDCSDCPLNIEGPSECPIGRAYEYVEWVEGSYNPLAEEIVVAAAYLDIPAEDIEECYEGKHDSLRDFIDGIMETFDDPVPSWVVIDYEATWHSSLRFDYVEQDGFYFRNI